MKKLLISITMFAVVFTAIIAGGFFLYKDMSKIPENVKGEAEKVGLTEEQLKEKIGQMIMIGFEGTEASENSDIYKIIKDVKIGSVVLFDYDVPSKSFPKNIKNFEQTKKLIEDLQKYSATPLFVAVDVEGGSVNRLKPEYGFLPVMSAEKMGQDKTLKTTEKESVKIAGELKSLGFNMNFAPVVDLNINPENPIIGALGRSFSADPVQVVDQARVFIENHLNNNIITVEKHFPGQGSAKEDSHLGIADVTDTYRQEELIPYQKLNEEGLLSAVMAAHVINKKIDDKYPASLSVAFLEDILRNQIGFEGVIISDDLQMDAISKNYGLNEAIIAAINADTDIVSVLNNSLNGYDKDLAYKVRDIIFNAVKENKIEEKRIIESYDRIIKLKKQFEIIEPSSDEVKSKNFELLQVAKNPTFGEIYDIAKNVEKITGVRAAFLLAISQEELVLEKTDMCYLANFDTGAGVRVSGGEKITKVMKPERDVKFFLDITKELKIDPLTTQVTCPMSFGWGGAMGPADFIPSTWMKYKDKIEKITGKPASPWDVNDAFLAMGLYLSDSGASAKTQNKEWDSAMIYFSNSPDSGYNFYADGVMALAERFQTYINIIEKN